MRPHIRMRPFLVSLFVLAQVIAQRPALRDPLKERRTVVPNKFIVEVESAAQIPNQRLLARRSLDDIYASIRARDVEFEVVREFDEPGIFVGASVVIGDSDAVRALQSLPGIRAIHPVRILEAPKPVDEHVIQGLDDPKVPPLHSATHVATGVDRVHAKGYFGKGIKAAIIDSGIEYTHPSLGGGFGPGYKVIGGYDLVGDDYAPYYSPPVPDDDPSDPCRGHGSHVAGIFGMDPGNIFNLTGVAPQASILAYRVFGCQGETEDDIIIAAILRAVRDGADIISMSIGGGSGWSQTASALAASRAAERGIVVVSAAGNAAEWGAFTTSEPGNGVNVISAGSVETTALPMRKATLHGVDYDGLRYFALDPFVVEGTLPIYVVSKNTTVPNDGCLGLPRDAPQDLSGYVTLFRAGGCHPSEKLYRMWDRGGNLGLIYDDRTGEILTFNLGTTTAFAIPAEDGEFVVKQAMAGVTVRISFTSDAPLVAYPNPFGSLMSPFSSYGPSLDFLFKPALSAPGGTILSTYLTPKGGWAILSGTSMATPFIAGAAALYLEAKGKSASNAQAIRDVFETTAKAIRSTKDVNSVPQTAAQTGAGLLNVYDAIFSETRVTPGELVLNDTAHFKGSHVVSITNNGKAAKTYTLSHVGAGTALTADQDNPVSPAPLPLVNRFATASISPTSFTLSPGQTRTVNIRITPPTNLDRSRYPLYSGAILISSSGSSETHRVTYLGLAANLKDKPILNRRIDDPYFDADVPGVFYYPPAGTTRPPYFGQTREKNYTWRELDFPILPDYPILGFWFEFATPRFRVDLVSANFTLPVVGRLEGREEPLTQRISFPQRTKPGTFAEVPTVGPIIEETYLARHFFSMFNLTAIHLQKPWFANGSLVPRGSYKFLIRALRVTGDPEKQEDYDSWLSPVVGYYYL